MKERIKSFIHLLKSRSSFKFYLDLALLLVVFATFFSIPFFSFNQRFYKVTWILTGLMAMMMTISIIFIYGLKVDIISVSFILFAVSSLISSAFSQFKAFKITTPILSILAFLIYSYCKSNPSSKKKMLLSIYLADILFSLSFLAIYRRELIGLDFSRLGSYFGDINDVSLFMSFGFSASFYYAFFSKKSLFKVLNCLPCLVFLVCGIATGSKIFIFSLGVSVILVISLFFGKKRWWISLIIVVSLVALFFIVLQLPMFSTIKQRLITFIQTTTGIKIKSNQSVSQDLSTVYRIDMFSAGLEMFFRKPIFGWGIWGFATYGGLNNGWSHNHFSETLCNFGIVGTIFFHVGFFKSIVSFAKTRSRDSYFAFIIIAFFIVAMFSVALNSEKLYSYLAPIAFCELCEKEKSLNFDLFKKRIHHENSGSNQLA